MVLFLFKNIIRKLFQLSGLLENLFQKVNVFCKGFSPVGRE